MFDNIDTIRLAIGKARAAGDTEAVSAGEGLLRILAIADEEADAVPAPYYVDSDAHQPDGPSLSINPGIGEHCVDYGKWQSYDVTSHTGDYGFSVFAGQIEIGGRKTVKLRPQGHLVLLAAPHGDASRDQLFSFFGGELQGWLLDDGWRWVVCVVPSRRPHPGELDTVSGLIISRAADAGLQLETVEEQELVLTGQRLRLKREAPDGALGFDTAGPSPVSGLHDYGSFLDLGTGKPTPILPMKPLNIRDDVPSFSETVTRFNEEMNAYGNGVRNGNVISITPTEPEPPPPAAPARRQRAA